MPYSYAHNSVLTFLSFIGVLGALIGHIALIYHAFKKLSIKQGLFSVIIPFYTIKVMLSLEESNFKKFSVIFYIGGFLLFTLISILQIIMTPQM
ncbi:hypothetical protein ACFL6D_03280 [Spirochaetota bacterium]